MTARTFGKMPDGSPVYAVTIGAGDLKTEIITYGASIRDLRLAGADHPLVLGFPDFDNYLVDRGFFGAVAGRCANRIGGGRFTLDGRDIQLTRNENGATHLHGGTVGFAYRNWTLEGHDDEAVALSIVAEDGEEGYPGRAEVNLVYRVEAPGTIRMSVTATTDAPTLVNIAQHSYFNLDGGGTILDHKLTFAANSYLPVDALLVPTGEIAPVAGTAFDFRQARPIRFEEGGRLAAYDHNFCVARERATAPRFAARLEGGRSGVAMEIETTEPGIQFYDGARTTTKSTGLGGAPYGAHSGLCLEPQVWPDSPNHKDFPSAVLRPGETYRQETLFRFKKA